MKGLEMRRKTKGVVVEKEKVTGKKRGKGARCRK